MNIFFLHWNPRKCAKYHCDKHVVKMIVESCQLLYTCHWIHSGPAPPPHIDCAPSGGYKPTHKKHPSVLWLCESLDNYRWLIQLTHELLEEYHYRYSDRTHACEKHLDWLRIVYPLGLVSKGLTPPKCAMPAEYKEAGDAVECYRAYYCGTKLGFATYRKRHRPHFLPRYNEHQASRRIAASSFTTHKH